MCVCVSIKNIETMNAFRPEYFHIIYFVPLSAACCSYKTAINAPFIFGLCAVKKMKYVLKYSLHDIFDKLAASNYVCK